MKIAQVNFSLITTRAFHDKATLGAVAFVQEGETPEDCCQKLQSWVYKQIGLSASIEDLQSKKEELELNIEDLETEQAILSEYVEHLESKKEAIESDVDELENNLNKAYAALMSLRTRTLSEQSGASPAHPETPIQEVFPVSIKESDEAP